MPNILIKLREGDIIKIKQTDKNLPKKINDFGCNFMSHLYVAKQSYTITEIIDIYNKAVKDGCIDENCTVKDPNRLLQLLGSNLRQIGGISLSDNGVWGEKETSSKIVFKIARWSQRNSRHNHFTLYNLKGEIYDPYDAYDATYSLEKLALLGYQFYGR